MIALASMTEVLYGCISPPSNFIASGPGLFFRPTFILYQIRVHFVSRFLLRADLFVSGSTPTQYSSSRFWFGFGIGCLLSVLIAAAVVVGIAYYSSSRVPQFATLTPLSETVSGDQELREDLLQGVYVTTNDE